MTDTRSGMNTSRSLLPLLAALALAACGSEEAEPTYEVGVTDESGGELIVADPDAPAIEDQTLPETAMTNVPVTDSDATSDTQTGAAQPAE